MAARQDQTLQIFLIVFIFLFLVTSVVAYLGWRGYSDQSQTAAALKTSLDDANKKSQDKSTELEDMRVRMGFGQNDTTADVMKASKADMDSMGGAVADEATRNYHKVLESVYTELQQTAAREADLKNKLKANELALLAVQTEAQKKIDQFAAGQKQADEDLAGERSKFTDQRNAQDKAMQELQKTLDSQQTKFKEQIDEREKSVKDLTAKNGKLDQANRTLIHDRKDEPESFEVADGRISWVNQNGTVWVNLGTADSLRRQVTFSVFDSDLHDAAKAKKKGSIEITRLLSEHMAEGRITKDDPKNPILTGDNIYSQIWQRGKKLHFALTGFIDIDGDGESDLQLARDLIELNGGIVDAYLDETGKVQGEITANTRYLVSGDKPDSPSKTSLQTGTNDMFKEASSLGVETITLPEFLTQMGYKPQDRTVHLGAAAKGSDFPAKPEHDKDPLGPAARFRPRQPPSTVPSQN